MTSKKVKCWASILGGCGGGQSREHYVTKGLYTGNIKGVGLPWCKEKPFDLPIDSLAANILCKKHNEMLSPLDGEAIRMKDFVVRAATPPSDKSPKSSHINYCSVDGTKIMRWLSKTICNLETVAKGSPDEVYVRHAFARPNAPVHVYVDKLFRTKIDANVSHFRFWKWHVDLKAGGETAIYIFRFSIYEWLVAPYALTQGECDTLGKLTSNRYWFKAKPIAETKTLSINRTLDGKKIESVYKLNLKLPKKRKRRRGVKKR